jgi:hypothetical protein
VSDLPAYSPPAHLDTVSRIEIEGAKARATPVRPGLAGA